MTMWQNSKAIILSSMVAGAAMLSSCATINSDGDYNRIISMIAGSVLLIRFQRKKDR